jgi:hypothetical protein
MLIACLRFGFVLATLLASLQVPAETRYWTLNGVQFEDGAVARYFSYDDATRTVANWNVRISGGAAPFLEWRLAGARSTFAVDPAQGSSGQHSALEVATNRVLMFDNGVARADGSRFSRDRARTRSE